MLHLGLLLDPTEFQNPKLHKNCMICSKVTEILVTKKCFLLFFLNVKSQIDIYKKKIYLGKEINSLSLLHFFLYVLLIFPFITPD